MADNDFVDNFNILRNDKYGRYAVAPKTIEPGEMIMTEVPFTFGPKYESTPVCLGCHELVDCTTKCTDCGWPVCGPDCAKLPIHVQNECQVFKSSGAKFAQVEDATAINPQYECITPLRVLLEKERNPERWEREVEIMEAHTEERKNAEIWQVEHVNVVEFLRTRCRMERFSEELIHLVCGILEVNAFAGHTQYGNEVRCLYPKTAIFSHSCVPNIRHSIFPNINTPGDEYRVYVRAAIKLEKGQEILISYTHTLAPTLFRRMHLRESKYFDCTCPRCSDPSELGTHLSTMKCNKCDNGVILSTNSLDNNAEWKCTHCEFKTKGESILTAFRVIQREIDELDVHAEDDPVAARESLIKRYRSILHPNHSFLLNLKYSLTQLYGRARGYQFDDLPDILLERKIELCRQILKVADVIKPGYSRQRGWNLYELHAPIVVYARNELNYGVIDERQLRKKLEEAAGYLEEAAIILSMEDPQSAEGMTGQMAFESLAQLKESLSILPHFEKSGKTGPKSETKLCSGSNFSPVDPSQARRRVQLGLQSMEDKCAVCDEEVCQRCLNCGLIGYCGKEHEKKHSAEHKLVCRPYKVAVSDLLGRHLVAVRDLKPGELVLKESPTVVGPRMASVPLCLGCFAPVPPEHLTLCSRCNVATMCSQECENAPGHVRGECALFQRIAEKNDQFDLLENLQIVLPLRCFALRDDADSLDLWEKFSKMESHAERRKNTEIWQLHRERVVKLLNESGILGKPEDETLMENICGILDVNSFELRGPSPALMTESAPGERLRGVYLEAALLAHDCVGNTHLSVDDSFVMTIHASVPISAGEPILFNYASSLECTPERLSRLEIGKYFTCGCQRCTDPTEMGTYMSAMICPRCRGGMVVPHHQGAEPLDWRCESCDHSYHPRLLKTALGQAWAAVEDADQSDTRAMEALLKKLGRTFPPTSVVMVEVKQNLVALYRDIILREPSPSRNILQRKITLCTDLLAVLKAVEPGISRLKGITLYELHVPLVMLANREFDSGEISSEELLKRLESADATLREAVSMLLYEPANSPEGKLLRLAMDELRSLRENISDVKCRSEDQSYQDKKKHTRGRKPRK